MPIGPRRGTPLALLDFDELELLAEFLCLSWALRIALRRELDTRRGTDRDPRDPLSHLHELRRALRGRSRVLPWQGRR
jgi:hypothetical protein